MIDGVSGGASHMHGAGAQPKSSASMPAAGQTMGGDLATLLGQLREAIEGLRSQMGDGVASGSGSGQGNILETGSGLGGRPNNISAGSGSGGGLDSPNASGGGAGGGAVAGVTSSGNGSGTASAIGGGEEVSLTTHQGDLPVGSPTGGLNGNPNAIQPGGSGGGEGGLEISSASGGGLGSPSASGGGLEMPSASGGGLGSPSASGGGAADSAGMGSEASSRSSDQGQMQIMEQILHLLEQIISLLREQGGSSLESAMNGGLGGGSGAGGLSGLGGGGGSGGGAGTGLFGVPTSTNASTPNRGSDGIPQPVQHTQAVQLGNKTVNVGSDGTASAAEVQQAAGRLQEMYNNSPTFKSTIDNNAHQSMDMSVGHGGNSPSLGSIGGNNAYINLDQVRDGDDMQKLIAHELGGHVSLGEHDTHLGGVGPIEEFMAQVVERELGLGDGRPEGYGQLS